MKLCKVCCLLKPENEFYRTPNNLDGFRGKCIPCTKIEYKNRRLANLERYSAKAKEWSFANKDRHRKLVLNWARENREKMLGYYRKYHKAHAEQQHAYAKAYIKKNRAWAVAKCRERYARKIGATPKWANKFFIEEIYDLAQLRTKATSLKWNVDHIVPLKSKLVCGLHVEHNLQVIPAIQNQMKKNHYWSDMP